jgi:hypothetical protein
LSEGADISPYISLHDCSVHARADSIAETPAIECINLSTNDGGVEVDLYDTEVRSSDGTGYVGYRAEFSMEGGSLEGSEHGAVIDEAEFWAGHAEICGDTTGISAQNGSVELRHSTVEGNEAGVMMSNCWSVIASSDLSGEENALAADGGTLIVMRSTFFTMGRAATLVDDCRVAWFENCMMLSVSTNPAIPVVELDVVDGTNAPLVELLGCVVRGMTASNTVALGGTATSGTVQMAECVLSADVGTDITVVSGTSVYGNNTIVNTPFTLDDLFPGGMDEDD